MDCPPILLLIFNRPALTQRVFARIREARPQQLFVAADGPRAERPNDMALCNAARRVIGEVDWPCDVKTLLRDENLGCHLAVSGAITWFFEQIDHGIVLEDDCLPTLDFFDFCSELLVRYQDDSRIGMISGNNYGFRLYDPSLSYSFSKHGHIWGWASWKRAWQKYDQTLPLLTSVELNLIKANISDNHFYADAWWKEATRAMQEPTWMWDYIWGVVRYANRFLTIRPKVNLVGNIGFGQEATHTKGSANSLYETTHSLQFPLVHPQIIVPDAVADKMLEDFRFPPSRKRRAVAKIRNKIRKWTNLN